MPNDFLELQTAKGRPKYERQHGQEEGLGPGSRNWKGAHLQLAHDVRGTVLMKEALVTTACWWFVV